MTSGEPVEKLVRVFSFGGGIQSVAVLCLQAMGELDRTYDAFVFANVGEKSEAPHTLTYFRDVALPFAEAHAINLIETCKRDRHGEPVDLYDAVMADNRSVPIPMYLKSGAPGNRSCTTEWKIRVVDKWIKAQGATHGIVGLGISVDEWERKRSEEWHTHYDNKDGEQGSRPVGFTRRREYPLLDMGITRAECHAIIARAGLPSPGPSSCWYCPFAHPAHWTRLRLNRPELFDQAVQMEQRANEKRGQMGKYEMFLHRKRKPLVDAVPEQASLFEDEQTTGCWSGVCFT